MTKTKRQRRWHWTTVESAVTLLASIACQVAKLVDAIRRVW